MGGLLAQWFSGGPGSAAGGVLLLFACLVFLVLGAALAVIDARTHRLPNRLVGSMTALVLPSLVLAAFLAGEPARVARTLLAACAVGALFLVTHLISPAALGFGDVKLVPALGALVGFLSWGHVVLAFTAGILLAGLQAMVVMLGTRDRRAHIAFGPALIVGTALAALV